MGSRDEMSGSVSDDRDFLSIGEVLTLLKEEFPDVTISKIRFLESQGLLDPERTPSGYRKFYEDDVERLRWILRQQRENFLPLKVIKGRLRSSPAGPHAAPDDDVPGPDSEVGPAPSARISPVPSPTIPSPASQAEPASPPASPPAPESPVASRVPPGGPGAVGSGPGGREQMATGANLSLAELAGATSLGEDALRDLERYGIIVSRKVGTNLYYDEEALLAAKLAASFMKFGVEARHLRMYKVGAEREAGFFEQVVMPMLKQRNPQSRHHAAEVLEELSALGQGLRAAMVRQALRDYLES